MTRSLDTIPASECYALLATQEIGRLGVNAEHDPPLIPVNYGMDGTTIVIRAHPGRCSQPSRRPT